MIKLFVIRCVKVVNRNPRIVSPFRVGALMRRDDDWISGLATCSCAGEASIYSTREDAQHDIDTRAAHYHAEFEVVELREVSK